MYISYGEYLKSRGYKDSTWAFKWWRIDIFHQSERDAIKFMRKNYQYRGLKVKEEITMNESITEEKIKKGYSRNPLYDIMDDDDDDDDDEEVE